MADRLREPWLPPFRAGIDIGYAYLVIGIYHHILFVPAVITDIDSKQTVQLCLGRSSVKSTWFHALNRAGERGPLHPAC